MSLLFIDGFGHYATDDLSKKWNGCYLGWSYYIIQSSSPRRVGTKYMRVHGGATYHIYKNFETAQDTLIIGFAIKIDIGVGSHAGWRLRHGSGDQCTVKVELDGSVTVRRGSSSGTILGQSAANVIVNDVWQYVEFKIKVHNSAGTYEVRVNGVSVVSGSGANTQHQATSDVSQFRIYGQGNYSYFTDLYIADIAGSKNNDFLGDCIIDVIMPSGAGNYAQWDVLVGPANYQDVDDPGDIDDDTTYVSTGVGAEKDSYAFGNLTATGRPILAVQSCLCARKDDGGNRRIKHLARISAADYLSAKQAIGDSYKVERKIWENSPATASAWTESEVNGAEFGVQLVTTTTTTSTTSTTTTV